MKVKKITIIWQHKKCNKTEFCFFLRDLQLKIPTTRLTTRLKFADVKAIDKSNSRNHKKSSIPISISPLFDHLIFQYEWDVKKDRQCWIKPVKCDWKNFEIFRQKWVARELLKVFELLAQNLIYYTKNEVFH